ncbi:MAG TPA: NAD(P)-dependent oxidoreductase [Vicinamibacterales bacterium]|nr:NAD(P)-dependent oxidoreductase [Vicinamibacterales bacterium]
MRVLVTGAAGLLGSAVVAELGGVYDVEAADRSTLDITDAAAVERIVGRVRPDAIVNCAAYNDVDGAETDAVRALSVNAFGVLTLARIAGEAGSALVHYSSDFVFDGETTRPYREEDEPRPRSVYAASKLLGEWFAADAPRRYVLRVESLFGPAAAGARRGSLGAIVDHIRRGEVAPVFVDRTVSPSFTIDVAAATRRLIASDAPAGLYHCVNDGAATWREVAEEAARLLGAELRIRPLTLGTASLKAARPRYCALSPARLASVGIVMPAWEDALARYLRAV